jgi:ATP-dependent phosphoenolpyruvate carboxykinase
VWRRDDDFGYEIAESVPGIEDEDQDLLHPREAFARLGRSQDYKERVAQRKEERQAFLQKFPGLDSSILAGLY